MTSLMAASRRRMRRAKYIATSSSPPAVSTTPSHHGVLQLSFDRLTEGLDAELRMKSLSQ